MTGYIHSVQSLSAVDGPGVRSVVFMNGCNMRCIYCHNPDTWNIGGGEEYTAEQLFRKIRRFKDYFGSDGGITVSGGEPLLQADFLTEFFALCKNNGISTCLDTAGSIINSSVEKLLDLTDLCLLDIKFATETEYFEYTKGSLEKTFAFLDLLRQKNIPVISRHVIVPGINNNPEYISFIKSLRKKYPNIIGSDLLPFRKLCIEKYESLNIPFPLQNTEEESEEDIKKLYGILNQSE